MSQPREELEAEVRSLRSFLNELEDDDFLERVQLTRRLELKLQELERLQELTQATILPITFRGGPVEGMRSIDAGFATKAMKTLIEAIDTVAASFSAEELKNSGRLPGGSGEGLRIVDIARGSFGFMLELPAPSQPTDQTTLLPQQTTHYTRAVQTTLRLIKEATVTNEDALSDLIAEIHPRAAAKVLSFIEVLSSHGALFSAEFEGERLQLERPVELEQIKDALRAEDIEETQELKLGVLIGALPESREFEAELDDQTIIRGKIDRQIQDVKAFKREWENTRAQLIFRVTRVRDKRRHVLTMARSVD